MPLIGKRNTIFRYFFSTTKLHKSDHDLKNPNLSINTDEREAFLQSINKSIEGTEIITGPNLYSASISVPYTGKALHDFAIEVLEKLDEITETYNIEDKPIIDIKNTPFKIIWICDKDGKEIPVISAGKHLIELLGLNEKELTEIKNSKLLSEDKGPNLIMNVLGSFMFKPEFGYRLSPGGLYIPEYTDDFVSQCEEADNSWESFESEVLGNEHEEFEVKRNNFSTKPASGANGNIINIYDRIDKSVLPKEVALMVKNIQHKIENGCIIPTNYEEFARELMETEGYDLSKADEVFSASMDLAAYFLRTRWD